MFCCLYTRSAVYIALLHFWFQFKNKVILSAKEFSCSALTAVTISALMDFPFLRAEYTSRWKGGFTGLQRKCISFLVDAKGWTSVSSSGFLLHRKEEWRHFANTEV